MRRFVIEKAFDEIKIEGEEHSHISQVLRLKINDEITCFCGDEFDYIYKIIDIQKKYTLCKLEKKVVNNANPKRNIVLFQGLPKGDKLELIIQKLNELGISKIIPFESDFTIAKFNLGKLDRLNKIALESCKQCGRSIPLMVDKAVSFKDMAKMLDDFDTVLFAYENERQTLLKDIDLKGNVALVIGSEGGFSNNEVMMLTKNKNVQIIGLGNRILRCETASIALGSYLSLYMEV